MREPDTELPIGEILPELLQIVAAGNRVVVQAPPGAGKTTRIPLALLSVLSGRIVLLEPRRMAARAAARAMAALLGEPVGHTVGYQMRMESLICAATRIVVVTEGILTRMIQDDPSLDGVGCLLFDEFHERSVHADLGLALALDCQEALREDLRILVMSATLDVDPLLRLLAPCPLVRSRGQFRQVETRYCPLPPGQEQEKRVASAVRRALDEALSGVLVFLPGVREIRRVQFFLEGLEKENVSVYALYGDLSDEEQDAALLPSPSGRRKVVLATSIAETSLTIEGIDAVVDVGLTRSSRFDPGTGMSRLVTTKVSRAQADQRRGRAGRLGPGICWRLWSREEDAGLQPFARPEIVDGDPAPLLLELALWGVSEVASLRWLDTPPGPAQAEAALLLRFLGALDEQNRITRHGRDMAALGLHPRTAHMVLTAARRGLVGGACLLAVLLEERDPWAGRSPGVDVRLRLEALAAPAPLDPFRKGKRLRLRELARRLEGQVRRLTGVTEREGENHTGEDAAGTLLALAYPDRVARQRGERGHFRMRNGRGAFVPPEDPLAAESFLAVGAVDGGGRNARIRQAAPLSPEIIDDLFRDAQTESVSVIWDAGEQAVLQRRRRMLGALVLQEAPGTGAPEAAVCAAVLSGIRSLGLECLPWTPELRQRRARIWFLRQWKRHNCGAGTQQSASDKPRSVEWPDVRDAWLLKNLEVWLEPFLHQITRRSEFRKIDLSAALSSLLPWELVPCLDKEAPCRLQVPSGSWVTLRYAVESLVGAEDGSEPEPPVLAVKLQEMFGSAHTPAVAGGQVPVRLHLLSPAGRPLQVTQDLESFWKKGYAAVRAEMRGRYPKHPWPEDPLKAVPTAATSRRGIFQGK